MVELIVWLTDTMASACEFSLLLQLPQLGDKIWKWVEKLIKSMLCLVILSHPHSPSPPLHTHFPLFPSPPGLGWLCSKIYLIHYASLLHKSTYKCPTMLKLCILIVHNWFCWFIAGSASTLIPTVWGLELCLVRTMEKKRWPVSCCQSFDSL